MCLGVWGQVMTKMESVGSDIWAWDPRRGCHTWETNSLARVRVSGKVFSDTWFPYMIWDPAPMIELGVWQIHDLHSIGESTAEGFYYMYVRLYGFISAWGYDVLLEVDHDHWELWSQGVVPKRYEWVRIHPCPVHSESRGHTQSVTWWWWYLLLCNNH